MPSMDPPGGSSPSRDKDKKKKEKKSPSRKSPSRKSDGFSPNSPPARKPKGLFPKPKTKIVVVSPPKQMETVTNEMDTGRRETISKESLGEVGSEFESNSISRRDSDSEFQARESASMEEFAGVGGVANETVYPAPIPTSARPARNSSPGRGENDILVSARRGGTSSVRLVTGDGGNPGNNSNTNNNNHIPSSSGSYSVQNPPHVTVPHGNGTDGNSTVLSSPRGLTIPTGLRSPVLEMRKANLRNLNGITPTPAAPAVQRRGSREDSNSIDNISGSPGSVAGSLDIQVSRNANAVTARSQSHECFSPEVFSQNANVNDNQIQGQQEEPPLNTHRSLMTTHEAEPFQEPNPEAGGGTGEPGSERDLSDRHNHNAMADSNAMGQAQQNDNVVQGQQVHQQSSSSSARQSSPPPVSAARVQQTPEIPMPLGSGAKSISKSVLDSNSKQSFLIKSSKRRVPGSGLRHSVSKDTGADNMSFTFNNSGLKPHAIVTPAGPKVTPHNDRGQFQIPQSNLSNNSHNSNSHSLSRYSDENSYQQSQQSQSHLSQNTYQSHNTHHSHQSRNTVNTHASYNTHGSSARRGNATNNDLIDTSIEPDRDGEAMVRLSSGVFIRRDSKVPQSHGGNLGSGYKQHDSAYKGHHESAYKYDSAYKGSLNRPNSIGPHSAHHMGSNLLTVAEIQNSARSSARNSVNNSAHPSPFQSPMRESHSMDPNHRLLSPVPFHQSPSAAAVELLSGGPKDGGHAVPVEPGPNEYVAGMGMGVGNLNQNNQFQNQFQNQNQFPHNNQFQNHNDINQFQNNIGSQNHNIGSQNHNIQPVNVHQPQDLQPQDLQPQHLPLSQPGNNANGNNNLLQVPIHVDMHDNNVAVDQLSRSQQERLNDIQQEFSVTGNRALTPFEENITPTMIEAGPNNVNNLNHNVNPNVNLSVPGSNLNVPLNQQIDPAYVTPTAENAPANTFSSVIELNSIHKNQYQQPGQTIDYNRGNNSQQNLGGNGNASGLTTNQSIGGNNNPAGVYPMPSGQDPNDPTNKSLNKKKKSRHPSSSVERNHHRLALKAKKNSAYFANSDFANSAQTNTISDFDPFSTGMRGSENSGGFSDIFMNPNRDADLGGIGAVSGGGAGGEVLWADGGTTSQSFEEQSGSCTSMESGHSFEERLAEEGVEGGEGRSSTSKDGNASASSTANAVVGENESRLLGPNADKIMDNAVTAEITGSALKTGGGRAGSFTARPSGSENSNNVTPGAFTARVSEISGSELRRGSGDGSNSLLAGGAWISPGDRDRSQGPMGSMEKDNDGNVTANGSDPKSSGSKSQKDYLLNRGKSVSKSSVISRGSVSRNASKESVSSMNNFADRVRNSSKTGNNAANLASPQPGDGRKTGRDTSPKISRPDAGAGVDLSARGAKAKLGFSPQADSPGRGGKGKSTSGAGGSKSPGTRGGYGRASDVFDNPKNSIHQSPRITAHMKSHIGRHSAGPTNLSSLDYYNKVLSPVSARNHANHGSISPSNLRQGRGGHPDDEKDLRRSELKFGGITNSGRRMVFAPSGRFSTLPKAGAGKGSLSPVIGARGSARTTGIRGRGERGTGRASASNSPTLRSPNNYNSNYHHNGCSPENYSPTQYLAGSPPRFYDEEEVRRMAKANTTRADLKSTMEGLLKVTEGIIQQEEERRKEKVEKDGKGKTKKKKENKKSPSARRSSGKSLTLEEDSASIAISPTRGDLPASPPIHKLHYYKQKSKRLRVQFLQSRKEVVHLRKKFREKLTEKKEFYKLEKRLLRDEKREMKRKMQEENYELKQKNRALEMELVCAYDSLQFFDAKRGLGASESWLGGKHKAGDAGKKSNDLSKKQTSNKDSSGGTSHESPKTAAKLQAELRGKLRIHIREIMDEEGVVEEIKKMELRRGRLWESPRGGYYVPEEGDGNFGELSQVDGEGVGVGMGGAAGVPGGEHTSGVSADSVAERMRRRKDRSKSKEKASRRRQSLKEEAAIKAKAKTTAASSNANNVQGNESVSPSGLKSQTRNRGGTGLSPDGKNASASLSGSGSGGGNNSSGGGNSTRKKTAQLVSPKRKGDKSDGTIVGSLSLNSMKEGTHERASPEKKRIGKMPAKQAPGKDTVTGASTTTTAFGSAVITVTAASSPTKKITASKSYGQSPSKRRSISPRKAISPRKPTAISNSTIKSSSKNNNSSGSSSSSASNNNTSNNNSKSTMISPTKRSLASGRLSTTKIPPASAKRGAGSKKANKNFPFMLSKASNNQKSQKSKQPLTRRASAPSGPAEEEKLRASASKFDSGANSHANSNANSSANSNANSTANTMRISSVRPPNSARIDGVRTRLKLSDESDVSKSPNRGDQANTRDRNRDRNPNTSTATSTSADGASVPSSSSSSIHPPGRVRDPNSPAHGDADSNADSNASSLTRRVSAFAERVRNARDDTNRNHNGNGNGGNVNGGSVNDAGSSVADGSGGTRSANDG